VISRPTFAYILVFSMGSLMGMGWLSRVCLWQRGKVDIFKTVIGFLDVESLVGSG